MWCFFSSPTCFYRNSMQNVLCLQLGSVIAWEYCFHHFTKKNRSRSMSFFPQNDITSLKTPWFPLKSMNSSKSQNQSSIILLFPQAVLPTRYKKNLWSHPWRSFPPRRVCQPFCSTLLGCEQNIGWFARKLGTCRKQATELLYFATGKMFEPLSLRSLNVRDRQQKVEKLILSSWSR